MANIYSSGAAFPDMSPTINNFVDNLVRLKTHQEDIDMRGRALNETTRQHNIGAYGTETPTPGMLTIPERQLAETGRARATAEEANRLQTEKFQTENPQAAPWNISNFMQLNSKLKLAGIPVDDIPFMNDLKTYAADPTMKRGDVAQVVEMKWPEWAAQTADALTQKVGKLSDQAADLAENDPKRKEILQQIEKAVKAQKLMEGIPADKVKQTLFPDIHQWEQKQEAAVRARMGKDDWVTIIGPDGKPMLVPASADLTGQSPFIEPKVANQQRKTREFEKDGKTWGQEYNFNPVDQTETLVGKPYLKSTPKPGAEGKLSDIEKQELIGVRADLRTVNRELLEVRRNAGFGMEAAKGRLPLIEAEYNDLKAREKELLTKDAGSTPTTPAAKPKVNAEALLQEANQAIARGADPAKVKKRLKEQYGIEVK